MRIILLALLVSFGVGACARLDDTPRRRTAEGLLQVVPTWKSISETNVVMQGFDYSCGAAALATLLKHYFGDAVTETDILRDILAHLDKKTLEERKEDGLSLLDLKEYAERHGYQAAGVRLKPDALPTLKGPILVYLETPEFRHFAILRGMREDRVYVADPARGNVRQPVDRFLRPCAAFERPNPVDERTELHSAQARKHRLRSDQRQSASVLKTDVSETTRLIHFRMS
jgi:predicted double-glycine peptidase